MDGKKNKEDVDNGTNHDRDPITNDDVATISVTNDIHKRILRLDKEVGFRIGKEGETYTDMLDKAIDKIILAVMNEQRLESIKQEEQIDDIRRVMSKRGEVMLEQLDEVLQQLKALKIDNQCDEIKEELTRQNISLLLV